MIIVLAHCDNGYCGCDSENAFFYEEGTTEEEINCDIWNWACDNAESYAHVHFGWHEATYEEYIEWCENWGYEPQIFD